METINVIRYSNAKIINLNTGKPILVSDIYKLYKSGVSITYTDAFSKEDLLKRLIKQRKSRYRIVQEDDETDIGPEEPIFKNKKFNCQECGSLTHNRFRCSACWAKEDQSDMGDFNYF